MVLYLVVFEYTLVRKIATDQTKGYLSWFLGYLKVQRGVKMAPKGAGNSCLYNGVPHNIDNDLCDARRAWAGSGLSGCLNTIPDSAPHPNNLELLLQHRVRMHLCSFNHNYFHPWLGSLSFTEIVEARTMRI